MRKALLGVTLALWVAPASHAATRLIYASNWSGSMELYGVDPSTRGSFGQLTTGAEPSCAPTAIPCGFIDPIPSPNGRRILFRGATWGLGSFRMGISSLWVGRADGANPVCLVAAASGFGAYTGLAGEPAWSPDSRKIAYAASGDVHVVDADGRNDRVLAPGLAGDVAWSRDGRSLFVLASRSLYVVRNGTPTRLLTDAGCQFALSPDARWVALTVCYDSRIRLIRVSGHGSPELGLGRGVEPVWAPNGRRLAFQSTAGIAVYDLKTQRIRLLTRDRLFLGWADQDGTGLAARCATAGGCPTSSLARAAPSTAAQ
jgi:Tol biopolymer transport system component